MGTTTYKVLGLGAKYEGPCVKCRQLTGKRDFELAATLLLRGPDGFAVAHPICVGVSVKHRISGGRTAKLPQTIEIEEHGT